MHAEELPGPDGPGGFAVRLENFAGPFEVLLSLIAKHEMDITQVALASVTDEFLHYVRALQRTGSARALDEASEFLVVAATLLDLKAARLLPRGEVEDQDDVALLEARDLLFARLLQYKAFKEVAGLLDERLRAESARFPRAVPLDPQAAAALPELDWRTTPEQLARLARAVLGARPGAPAEVGTDHLHGAAVSVPDEAEVLAGLLADGRPHGFRALVADAASTLVVVVRFLALLEMYRDAVVDLVQDGPLGELTVRWTDPDGGWSAGSPGDDAPSTAEPVPAAPRAAELTAGALA
ncbi:segregation and condensation protein A [Kocuria rosea]|uniref:segregation and condensation protein A n=1 Tax=Kocuria rosea TaxID=1275 RepID=UPI00203DFE6C|nr:ScpA family protein [Kocuria rosea]MCM3688401.1 segregation/condensation protein A [Kocuria rosea]